MWKYYIKEINGDNMTYIREIMLVKDFKKKMALL